MTSFAVLMICVFGQVALTLWAIISMGMARIKELKKREIPLSEIALATDAYPEHIKKLQNNATNQFETPMLFFAAAGFAVALDMVGVGIALGAVLFFASRLVHRSIHIRSNRLQSRFKAFVVGLLGLVVMWLSLAYGLLSG